VIFVSFCSNTEWRRMTSFQLAIRSVLLCTVAMVGPRFALGDDAAARNKEVVSQFCAGCHGTGEAEAGVNFESLLKQDTVAADFRTWLNVAIQLEQRQMPPAEADQPSPAQRAQLLAWVRNQIQAAVHEHEGDPGHVVIRRLTSAEYGYAIRDLTGIDLEVERGFVSDSVGGAGFTNTGIVQFTQDSTLERYLEAARHVAHHAVVGTGPLSFFRDPGQTGFELSAIDRIQTIYREHGFRTAAGEGGESFGLDRYTMAFFAAWQYRNRKAAGEQDLTIADCAKSTGLDTRFVQYVHSVVTRENPSFPTSEIVNAWRKLPPARTDFGRADIADVAERCQKIAQLLFEWQNRFGSNTDAKEEAPVLRADLFDVKRTQLFEMSVNWPKGTKTAHLVLSVESANRIGKPDAVIKWQDAKIQFRDYAKVLQDPRPLRDHLTEETVARLEFGKHPRGGRSGRDGFVTVGTKAPAFELPIPEGATSARLLVTAELDVEHGEDCIVRCTIAQLEETDQGKSVSGLLASPDSKTFAAWKDGVLEFARLLPQMSQREPAPSDRDPIPAPIDPTYNNPERNFFHTRIKYFRDDAFLVEHILDDETRLQLDQAWADLLGSFEFHDTWLQLLARTFDLQLDGRRMENLDEDWIAAVPAEARVYVKTLKSEFDLTGSMFAAAESRHLADILRFAARAWRRPLSTSEQNELHAFYQSLRTGSKLDHRASICAVVARVLVSPAFLYRAERGRIGPATGSDEAAPLSEVAPLSQWELASRLSFFLWSSVPDAELRRAASAGELATPEQLAAQAKRMLSDPQSRRFATEFFGQWFGFYRFGQYRGIDADQFPEFSDSLRQSMHNEAVEFFDFIVRRDRPINEILFANYAFVNQELAAHYGFDIDPRASSKMQRVDNADQFHRGGLLRLGAVLATTSAPRRTSPVRRGDWILRRVLGTPVPPPPADAGSIDADEVVADGLSIRQRLEAHRRDASCHNCHSRFDAFGFALENYDPLGRWRDRYRDQKPVETTGTLRDGKELVGDKGLHEYLASQQSRFHRTLADKLLGYALGRRVSVGDQPLVSRLTDHMQAGGGMSGLVERIVGSRQFRYHRSSTPMDTPASSTK
jgi:mono/diheme cytochrome c family protein